MNSLSFFEFGQSPVRVVTRDGEPWFLAKDVCRILEISNVGQALTRLDEDEKSSIILNDGTPGNPNTAIVSESGMYALVLGSRKAEAKAFRKWVTATVLPEIRRTGSYHRGKIMANQLIDLLKADVQEWNEWRKANPEVEVDLSSAKLNVANLRGANLRGANLSFAKLNVANLSYTDLSNANLYYANLYYANLGGANLEGADLRYADLSYANLGGANLGNANLASADLYSANLYGANLDGANLYGANLDGANQPFVSLFDDAS